MERQVKHLVRLVDDLLEASRINRGLLELRRERVRLSDVVRSALEACETLVNDSDHRLEAQLPNEPLWMDADPVRLGQVLTNLLNNAARYTDRGGSIVLRARREPGSLVSVSVLDTGMGFDPEAKEQLFQMYSRGIGSQGLGIGLALARRLVEMHGGTIDAKSDGVGCGAEFIVTLPLADAPAERQRSLAQSPRSEGATYRVLVADDNRDAAKSLAMLLRALGHEVAVVYDGTTTVSTARSFRPHIALLDIGMPGLDGYGAARAIRGDPDGQHMKIVALTGWGQDEDARRAREAGFDAHLVKPAELETLRHILMEMDS
jgi:CheY-like chemotaxis protein